MIALLIDLGWKSALICGVALMLVHMLRNRAAIERVTLLRVAAALLLALPAFTLILPSLEIGILPSQEAPPINAPAIAHIDGTNAQPVEAPGISAIDMVGLVYAMGVACVLLRLFAGLLTLGRWTRTARPVSDPYWRAAVARASARLRRPVRLLVSSQVGAPLSWGASWILIGPAIEARPEQADAVIAHEMAHIRRLDWPMLVISRLAAALFWFNPLAWLVDRELARQAELAADEEAVRHVAHADYAQTLLTVANMAAHPAACGMSAPRTILAVRIGRVLEGTPRPPANRLLCTALLICAPGVIAPLAAAKLVSTPLANHDAPSVRVQFQPPKILRAVHIQDQPKATTPQAKPRSVARTTAIAVPAPSPVPVVTTQKPEKSPEDETPAPAPTMRHAMLTPTEDATERRRAERRGRAIIAAGRREFAKGLSDSANGMRREANALEGAAAQDRLPSKDREEHLRMARSLRVQAEQLDAEARRLIQEPRS